MRKCTRTHAGPIGFTAPFPGLGRKASSRRLNRDAAEGADSNAWGQALHRSARRGHRRRRFVRIAEGLAQFAGAATEPAHRRRGVQTALLSARLADAAAVGGDIAVITTVPGSKSQQNAQRQGFDLLYTRAVLLKQP